MTWKTTYLLGRSSMATLKTCFKCNTEKPLTEFYRHAMMGDGHLNKCKECAKRDVRAHRAVNDSVREYDRERAKLPHRIAQAKRIQARWRDEYPERREAHNAVQYALRSGRIVPLPCWACGAKAEAHHPDYSSPLDVIWLCPLHHKQLHAMVA
jgi:hypothetical protein